MECLWTLGSLSSRHRGRLSSLPLVLVSNTFLLPFLAMPLTDVRCITARRRRRMGRNPYPLTGWAGGSGPAYNNQQSYYNQQPAQGYNQGYNQGTYGAPPPAYGQQQQQYGNMPSQPGPIYQGARGGENVYGNDQSKKDNVVR